MSNNNNGIEAFAAALAEIIAAADAPHINEDFKIVLGSDRGRTIDDEVRFIHRMKLSGTFYLTSPRETEANSSVRASFKDGVLHCPDGPAWTEGYGYDRLRKVWALNGRVIGVNDDDYCHVPGEEPHTRLSTDMLEAKLVDAGITAAKTPYPKARHLPRLVVSN